MSKDGWIGPEEAVERILKNASDGTEAAREAAFQRGSHHAATRLAEALKTAQSVEECRRMADEFVDVIGEARGSRDHFDLHVLIGEARRRAKP